MDQKIVSVRFTPMGKAYHFDASGLTEVRKGDFIVVETTRGWQLGQIVDFPQKVHPPADGSFKHIDRIASARDLAMRQSWQAKESEVTERARTRARELRLQGVKIISAEYSFDGLRLSISFSTESEDKVELKSLRSDMQKAFAPAQVEIRQIGPRDVARVFHGIGACGMEQRCCSTFLTDFSSISIRMAKEQGISLTPGEITGMCGRLRCCLNYEYEQYCAMRQDLPKKNKRVMTPVGEGKVVDVATLRQRVIVEIPDSGRREFGKEEITVLEDDHHTAPPREVNSEVNPELKKEIPEEKKLPSQREPFAQPAGRYSRPQQGNNPRQDDRRGNRDRKPQGNGTTPSDSTPDTQPKGTGNGPNRKFFRRDKKKPNIPG
jgi:cell fate regulator YaaT (PSP1 superfamily)